MKCRGSLGNTLKIYIKVSWKNLEESNKFLDAFSQPKLNQEKINHPNRSIKYNEISGLTMSLSARHWWLKLLILATQEAEFRRITV
jgi:hypothetical protein